MTRHTPKNGTRQRQRQQPDRGDPEHRDGPPDNGPVAPATINGFPVREIAQSILDDLKAGRIYPESPEHGTKETAAAEEAVRRARPSRPFGAWARPPSMLEEFLGERVTRMELIALDIADIHNEVEQLLADTGDDDLSKVMAPVIKHLREATIEVWYRAGLEVFTRHADDTPPAPPQPERRPRRRNV